MIQVRLEKGERVELLDEKPTGDGKWYEIAPPAGEFRWVHMEYLDRHLPDELVKRQRAQPGQRGQGSGRRR